MNSNAAAIELLLQSRDPSVRYWTLVDLLGKSPQSASVKGALAEIPNGPRVKALFAGQGAGKRRSGDSLAIAPGGFGVHPYKKWDGAHWRLVSLVELGVPANDVRAHAAAEQVLKWLTGDTHRSHIKKINGRTRRCASQEGNALAVCSRLGLAGDPRVRYLAESLVLWQWPDGGWNCDKNPRADHSSFYESLAPLWGLTEFAQVTQEENYRQAADRAAEFFLCHRLFRSDRNGRVINPEWLKLHYPLYWHYDILQGLVILTRVGKAGDPRAQEALEIIASKQGSDGMWRAEQFYWRPQDKARSQFDVVDWGWRGPNEMITLNALRVLKAGGRW